LTLSATYLLLSNGVYLKDFSLPSLHINKLYIKWNEKLNINIDKLTILTNEDESSSNIEVKDIKKHLKSFGLLTSFIESFIIEKINYRDISATLRYLGDSGGYVRASSKNFNIDTIIHKTDKYINFEILSFKDSIKQISANGNLVLDLINRQIVLDLKTDIGKDISLNIFSHVNTKKLKYAITSNKKILDYGHFISMLNPNEAVKYWAYEAIKMKSGTLKKAYGYIDFAKPDEAFENFYLSLDVDGMDYTYNKALDSIHTESTNLEFKKGVLNIRPINHTTYNFFLDKSWLKIDFSKKEFILTLYLLLDGFVDDNLLFLLKTFNIALPLQQNSGVLKTDLTLTINLHTIDVDAVGTFSTKEANINYLGLDLDVYDSIIRLENFNVYIDKMFAKYKDTASAYVTANLDVKHHNGLVSFDVTKANFGDDLLTLDKEASLKIQYIIKPTEDLIKVYKSKWNILDNENIYIEALEIPFNYENLFAKIPTTEINIENIATIYASGSASFKTMSTNLEFDLTNLEYNGIKLAKSNTLLDLSFAESKLGISTNDYVKFTLNNQDFSIFKPKISFYKNKIIAKSSELRIDNLLHSEVSFNYSIDNLNGFLNMQKIKFKNDALGSIFENNKYIGFNFKNQDNKITAHCPEVDVSLTIDDNKWNIAINSLKLLHKHSKVLQKYDLNNGKVSVFKQKDDKHISFIANINHENSFLSIDNKLVSNYIIEGTIEDENNEINININNRVKAKINDQILITGKNIGVNLGETVDFLSSIRDPIDKSNSKVVNVDLIDSSIYFSENRKALADHISLQYYNNIATAQLSHSGAEAGFKLQDDIFYLYGEDFNDKFMENLFALSKFQNGSFDFSIKGSLDEFVGIIYIKDTTVVEYKLLNNVLAFVNTIPSLVTFSLPGYNTDGLDIKSSYINFSYKDDIYTLKDIYLDSKEMQITGNGVANYKADSVDINLNLKTDLGSTMSKIPIVGYIVFDEDSISTSLKVSGVLSDPKVESMIATDIIVAPLNIIKRTLLFPFKIFE